MSNSFVVRTHQGLGDAVYAYPIVKYLTSLHDRVKVKTSYPIVFSSIDVETVRAEDRSKPDCFPKYTNQRGNGLGQYETMLNSVNLTHIPFVFDWGLGFSHDFKENHLPEFAKALSDSRKPMCIIKEPCLAHMHKRNNDTSIVPNLAEMQIWVNMHKDIFFFVSVGNQEVFENRLVYMNYDLNNKTTVQDLITLCSMAEAIATQVGHLVPIAQGLNKPLKVFWPSRITDARLKGLSPENLKIDGVENETI